MPTDAETTRKAGRAFYLVTITLLLAGVATAVVQKQRESAVAIAVATRVADRAEATDECKSNVQHIIQDAAHWGILSLAAVMLAIVSWGVAVSRQEKCRWASVCIIVLLSLYAMLQLMMV